MVELTVILSHKKKGSFIKYRILTAEFFLAGARTIRAGFPLSVIGMLCCKVTPVQGIIQVTFPYYWQDVALFGVRLLALNLPYSLVYIVLLVP